MQTSSQKGLRNYCRVDSLPTARMWTASISAAGKKKDWRKASKGENLCCPKSKKVLISTRSTQGIMNYLLNSKRFLARQALELLFEGQSNRLGPNVIATNAAIGACEKAIFFKPSSPEGGNKNDVKRLEI